MTAYTPAELADAFARSPLGRHAGLTLDEALGNPALRRVLEIGAPSPARRASQGENPCLKARK